MNNKMNNKMDKEIKTQPQANIWDDSVFANLPGEELSDRDLEAISGGQAPHGGPWSVDHPHPSYDPWTVYD